MTALQERIFKKFSGAKVLDNSCFSFTCKGADPKTTEAASVRVFDWCQGCITIGDTSSGGAALCENWLSEALKIANEFKTMVMLMLVSHAHVGVVEWCEIDVNANGDVEEYDMTKAAEAHCIQFCKWHEKVSFDRDAKEDSGSDVSNDISDAEATDSTLNRQTKKRSLESQ